MKIGAIIQARMLSKRFPGKVLKELPFNSGISALEQIVRRLKTCSAIDNIVIATSTYEEDDPIVAIAKKTSVDSFRGSMNNVLERYYQAASSYSLHQIIRITSDCPCIDPLVINNLVDHHLANQADFTSTAIERTFPIGMDAGIMTFRALKEAWENAQHEYEKEHVTAYFYKSYPERYKIGILKAEEKYIDPDIRITLDTPEDYILLCAVYDSLYIKNPEFGMQEIIELFHEKPWMRMINQNIPQKKIHKDLAGELDEVIHYCRKQDLYRTLNFLEKVRKK